MSKLSPIFKDRISSKVRNSVVFSPSLLAYVTASLSSSVSTSATQRLGLPVVPSPQPVSRSYESNGVGGKRILNVIVSNGLDDNDDQIDIRHLDSYRVGKNIKTYSHFSSQVFRPMIRVSPESFFEEEKDDIINHYASFNSYGFGLFHKTVDENFKIIPVKDFSELIPTDLVGKTSVFSYPFVFNDIGNYDQFVDPSHPGIDGGIDVFEVRQSLASLSTSDIQILGAKGQIMGGGIEQNRKGTVLIQNVYDVKVHEQVEFYDDAQETLFAETLFKTRGDNTSDNDSAFSLPGYIDSFKNKITPFNEKVDYLTGSYSFATSNMNNFLSSSRNSVSEIGSRFKSATCGLIFGESNALGTDSIAFGGLKK